MTKQPRYTMNRNRQRLKYAVCDAVSSIVVWILFLVFRWMVYDGRAFGYGEILIPAFNFYTPLLLYPLGCLTVHYLSGYYMQPFRKSIASEFLTTFIASAIIAMGAFFAIVLDDVVINYQRYYYSLIVLFLLQFTISYIPRLIITLQTHRYMRNGDISLTTAIVGTGQNALRIADELRKNIYENRVIGFIRAYSTNSKMQSGEVLGNIEDFAALKQKYAIESVVVALDDHIPEQDLYATINKLYPYNIEIQFTPRIYEVLTGVARIKRLDVSPLVNITEHSMADWQLSMKRAIDMGVSAIALVLFLPLFIFCAIRIKTDSKGPVFYRQERIGLHGRPFQIIKFRTMYVNSENGIPKLSSATDKRITPFGHWMRKYRVDELPQFWNVLIGEMSLVGPRPERKYYIDRIIERAPYYCLLYKIRPGLTSWGPIKIGYSDTLDKMIERLNYDIIYMDNMSLLIDIKILFYTIEVIVKGKGQ